MISTLLDKIGGLFEKDFLFASFLPVLLFASAVIGSLAAVLGMDAAWGLVESLSASQKGLAATAAAVTILVLAYVLNGLRPVLLAVWSGTHEGLFVGFVLKPLCFWAGLWQQRRFERMRREAQAENEWVAVLAELRADASESSKKRPNRLLPAADRIAIVAEVRGLSTAATCEEVRPLAARVAGLFARYTVDSLQAVYGPLQQALDDRVREGQTRQQTRAALLDRSFGGVDTIRPTELGNLVESYEAYPSKRYQMEARLFWSRLRLIAPDKQIGLIEEPRIVLDFSLAMATFAAAYATLAAFAGPWLWPNLWLWAGLAVVGCCLSRFFYRRAVTACRQYAELNRACFDLYRLDLLKALRVEAPQTITGERERWRTLSQLLVYGESDHELPMQRAEVAAAAPAAGGKADGGKDSV